MDSPTPTERFERALDHYKLGKKAEEAKQPFAAYTHYLKAYHIVTIPDTKAHYLRAVVRTAKESRIHELAITLRENSESLTNVEVK